MALTAIVEQALMDLGMDALPESIELVRGKGALSARVGGASVASAIASTSFTGGRKVPRGTWSGYVFVDHDANHPIVALPTDSEITRSSFLEYPALVEGLRTAFELEAGLDYRPSREHDVDGPTAWQVTPTDVLGLDTEGFEKVERVSMAIDGQHCSWQWSHAAREVVQAQLNTSKLVLAHMAWHDASLLTDAGVDVPYHKLCCTMEAHVLLSPWRNKGLGYAAPLYAATVPFKGSVSKDPHAYSLHDAWILPRMWRRMWPAITHRRLERIHETDQTIAGIYHGSGTRVVRAREGVEGAVERASGCMETHGLVDFNLPEGRVQVEVLPEAGQRVIGIRDPYLQAFRVITGHDLRPVAPEDHKKRAAFVRYLRTGAVDASRRGLKDAVPTRAALLDMIPPEVTAWHEGVAKALRKDDYVQSPTGRRWYHGRLAQAADFLLTSTIMDTYRYAIAATGVIPINQSLWHVTVREDQAKQFLEASSKILPKPLDVGGPPH